MSEFSEKMGMAAGNNFKSGYNCCEAIVQTFRKEAGVNIDDNAFRLQPLQRYGTRESDYRTCSL